MRGTKMVFLAMALVLIFSSWAGAADNFIDEKRMTAFIEDGYQGLSSIHLETGYEVLHTFGRGPIIDWEVDARGYVFVLFPQELIALKKDGDGYREVGSVEMTGKNRLIIAGNLLYATTYMDTEIIDVRNPKRLRRTGRMTVEVLSAVKRGCNNLLATPTNLLVHWNSFPQVKPRAVYNWSNSMYRAMALLDNTRLLVADEDKIRILDIRNLTKPSLISQKSYDTGGSFYRAKYSPATGRIYLLGFYRAPTAPYAPMSQMWILDAQSLTTLSKTFIATGLIDGIQPLADGVNVYLCQGEGIWHFDAIDPSWPVQLPVYRQ